MKTPTDFRYPDVKLPAQKHLLHKLVIGINRCIEIQHRRYAKTLSKSPSGKSCCWIKALLLQSSCLPFTQPLRASASTSHHLPAQKWGSSTCPCSTCPGALPVLLLPSFISSTPVSPQLSTEVGQYRSVLRERMRESHCPPHRGTAASTVGWGTSSTRLPSQRARGSVASVANGTVHPTAIVCCFPQCCAQVLSRTYLKSKW